MAVQARLLKSCDYCCGRLDLLTASAVHIVEIRLLGTDGLKDRAGLLVLLRSAVAAMAPAISRTRLFRPGPLEGLSQRVAKRARLIT